MSAFLQPSGLEVTRGRRIPIPKRGTRNPLESGKDVGDVGPLKAGEYEVAPYWFFGTGTGIQYDASRKLILPDVQLVEFKPGIQGVGYDERGNLDITSMAAELQGARNAFPVHAVIGLPPEKFKPDEWFKYTSQLLDPVFLCAFEKHYSPRNGGRPMLVDVSKWTPANVLRGLRGEISSCRRRNATLDAQEYEEDYQAAVKRLAAIVRAIDEYRKRPPVQAMKPRI